MLWKVSIEPPGFIVNRSLLEWDCLKKERQRFVFVPIQDSTTSAFQLNCRKAEFSSSLAFLWAAALSSSDTLPRRADILALMLSTWWLFYWKHTHHQMVASIATLHQSTEMIILMVLKKCIFSLMLYNRYLLDELLSVSTHIIHSVPVHSEVSLKCFMLFQQTLLKTSFCDF